MRPGVSGLIEVGEMEPGLLQGEQSPGEQRAAEGATHLYRLPELGRPFRSLCGFRWPEETKNKV